MQIILVTDFGCLMNTSFGKAFLCKGISKLFKNSETWIKERGGGDFYKSPEKHQGQGDLSEHCGPTDLLLILNIFRDLVC